ncbi:MAG: hypothetical protein GC181_16465, partial [Bacteroidetes bacterium]|nr:hypothetical protein [Bacteroidota bacterium]
MKTSKNQLFKSATRLQLLILCVVSLLVSTQTLAQDHTYIGNRYVQSWDSTMNGDTTHLNSFITNFDALSYDTAGNFDGDYPTYGFVEYQLKGRVALELVHTLDSCFPDSFTFWADILVSYRGKDSSLKTDTIRLQIVYDTTLGTFNQEIASYLLDDVLWLRAKLLACNDIGLLKYTNIVSEITVERYRDLDVSTSPDFYPISLNSQTNELNLSWDASLGGVRDGALGYQLEWTWVDAVGQNKELMDPSQVWVDFRHNATRVELHENSYSISPVYEKGYLVFRVRPYGVNKYKVTQPVYGPYSSSSHGTRLDSFTSGYEYVTLDHTSSYFPHDTSFNWQYAASFAEEGKKKEVISYYDGSLRNRQAVTRISSTMQAVVGETVYDFEGRPAVNILPVPAFDSKLRFHPAFNISQQTNIAYNKNDFDSIPSSYCLSDVAALKTVSGASKYYSPDNDSVSFRNFGFIPDAHGFPMAVTEYMADGTGRLKRQSGVGTDHQLESGHETKYYYATPGDQELDRLFGNNVGDHIHYQKEMVIDPNGQVSVSYKDLSGKVIATSLAGDSPDSMVSLASESGAQVDLNMVIPSTYYYAENNVQTDKVFVVSSDSTRHDIFYDLTIPRLTLDSVPDMCFDCVYELTISLLDDCNNEYLDGNDTVAGNQPIVRMVGLLGEDFDVSCDSSSLTYNFTLDEVIDDSTITVYLNKGRYTLKKSLTISDNAYLYYWEKLLQAPNIKQLEDFEAEAIAEQDTSACYQTCASCLDSLGDYATYNTSRYSDLLSKGYDSAQVEEITLLEYNQKQLQCSTLCNAPITTCQSIYMTLLLDVMPGGQYFPLLDSTTGEIVEEGIFDLDLSNPMGFNYQQYKSGGSWYYHTYYDQNGDTAILHLEEGDLQPVYLPDYKFYELYDAQWSKTLVQYHPEYCVYEFCVANQESYDYNDSLYATETFKQAYEKGYLCPIDTAGVGAPSTKDPFFTATGHETLKTKFKHFTDSVAPYVLASSTACDSLSLLEIALISNYSDGDFSSCSELKAWLNYYLPLDTSVLCDQRADAVWQTFRGMYIARKESFFRNMPICNVTIPSGYAARFYTSDAAIYAMTGANNSETNTDTIYNQTNRAVIGKCDTFCMNQASYWLYKLGGCNLDSATQAELIEAFTAICRNGCDANHPMGARDYPDGLVERVTVPVAARSFEEAFDLIVPDSLKISGQCDVWTIGFPYSYKSTMSKLAALDSSCVVGELNLDSCYAGATTQMQQYMYYNKWTDTSLACEDCIYCDDLYQAWDSLAQKYGGVFIDSTWELKQVMTNYFNSYFGFNLTYFEYKDFVDECYSVGSQSINENADLGMVLPGFEELKPKEWLKEKWLREPKQERFWMNPYSSTHIEYASVNNRDFYPVIASITMNQTESTKSVDTCVCNQLADYLDDFGVSYPSSRDSILQGTANNYSLELFDNFMHSFGCPENDPDVLSDLTQALMVCLQIHKDIDSTDLLPEATWSEHAANTLNTYVANFDMEVTIDIGCLDSCSGDNPPSSFNSFWDGTPLPIGYYDSTYYFGGYPTQSCTSCPECQDLKDEIYGNLRDYFGQDTTIYHDQWEQFKECFYSSLCRLMDPNSEWLCQNCDPEDSITGASKIAIADIYNSVWSHFNDQFNTIWEVTALKTGFGIEQGDSVIPWEDTLDASERMKLMMLEYGKCILLPCHYCYPGCDDGTCSIPPVTCCMDTTIYFTKLKAFFNDFTAHKGFLGNYFPYSGWDAYPMNVNYYSTPLYQGNCHTNIHYRLINNRMPLANFVMEDDCGDKFYVNLSYLFNYGNQANYGNIISIDSIKILPEPEPLNCNGTSRFAVLARQTTTTGDTITIELVGIISDYQLFSAIPSSDGSCAPPKLCNRQIGTLNRTLKNLCVAEKMIRANSIAKIRYDLYIDSLREDFRKKYYNKCMTAVDSLNMDYQVKEYHYTLYYYDQAGNLIQTVPPEGVQMITSSSTLAQVKTYREQGTGSPYYPTHTLKTRYRYNTLNEVRWQYTPDSDSSLFWYDRLGRMAVSQNAKQRTDQNYSYTLYDSLGRIHEVGQIHQTNAMTVAIAFDTNSLSTWITAGTSAQITRTWYDASPVDLSGQGFMHRNLRSRVSAMAYYESEDSAYQHAVFYDYDIHGNVQELVREIPALHFIEQGYKFIRYEYDLVSGNVNSVYYQENEADRFTHRYAYDADNRLDDVFTTVDDVHWDKDASYYYYLHGPLRRMQLGQLDVQGVDYAYTIHGWLKGVNSNSLNPYRDLGQDGFYNGNVNENVARDVFGYSLHYYHGDYDPINEMDENYADSFFLMSEASSAFGASVKDLFNGNIGRMVTALDKVSQTIVGKAYTYDQLNRISSSLTYLNGVSSTNSWGGGAAGNEYKTNYTYDANGNILSLYRRDENGLEIDHLTYHYTSGTNQLAYVDDTVTASNYSYDIDDQSSGNYQYDEIGNLISDVSEEIESIEWTVYGKIKSITRTSGSTKPNLTFEYSPDGHRVAKHVIDSLGNTYSTWYVRDASGNIMATYSRTWEVELDTSDLLASEIYAILKTDKSFESRLTYFDEAFEWENYVPSSELDQLETDLASAMKQQDFLDNFDAINYMSDSIFNLIYGATSDTALVTILRTAMNDEAITTILCDSCTDDLLVAMMNHSYHDFLEQLSGIDPALFNYICTYLSIPEFLPPPDKITQIMSSSSISGTSSIITGSGMYNCNSFTSILDNLVSLNSSSAQLFFDSVANFSTCIYNNVTHSDLLQYFQDYYGNDYMWGRIFYYASGTQGAVISGIRDTLTDAFIYNSVKELGSSEMDIVVSTFTGASVTHWLETIQSHYGSNYYNLLVQQLLADHNNSYWSYMLEEHHIYGSSRLGIKKRNLNLYKQIKEGETWNYISTESDTLYKYTYLTDSIRYCYRGATYYELSNHLGNVLAVITDRKIQNCSSEEVQYYEAQVVSISDYYPFGMMMHDRSYSNANKDYRFGFNGQERDDEVSGKSNSMTAEFWQYD